MKIIIYTLISFIMLVVVISIIWRICSQWFSLPCPAWLGWLIELDNPFTVANQARVIIEHLDLKAGMQVLDVGCGPGRLTIPIASKIKPNGHVVAMDIQKEMLFRVQEKAQAAHITNIKFLNAGIGEGRLNQDQFDRVLLVTVLGEIPKQESALQEIFNSLKIGGILSVTESCFDPHFQRIKTVIKLAGKVGFKQKKLIGNRFAYTIQFEKPA